MEDATNPMVVTAMLELGVPLSVEVIRERLHERLARLPRFRMRIVEPRFGVGAPSLEDDPAFDLARHVEHVELATPAPSDLRAFVSAKASALLDPARPLWRAWVVDRPGAGTSLLFRVHHALADGFALLAVLASLCDEAETVAPAPAKLTQDEAHALREYLAAAARLVTLPPDSETMLKRPLSPEKRVAWTEAIALADVKEAARAKGATVNDVLVAVVSGALRRAIERSGQSARGLDVRAMVPVNLRPPGQARTLGNRFGLVVLDLPVGVPTPLGRLAAVRQAMRAIKGSREPVLGFALLSAMGLGPRRVEDAGVAFFGQKASLVLTNVPGPRERLHFAGAPIARMVFWAPQSGRMGLGVGILSYAGEVTLGVVADARLIPEPESLAADVHVELDALRAQIRAEAAAEAEAEAEAEGARGAPRPLG
jgi:hypothetical protein